MHTPTSKRAHGSPTDSIPVGGGLAFGRPRNGCGHNGGCGRATASITSVAASSGASTSRSPAIRKELRTFSYERERDAHNDVQRLAGELQPHDRPGRGVPGDPEGEALHVAHPTDLDDWFADHLETLGDPPNTALRDDTSAITADGSAISAGGSRPVSDTKNDTKGRGIGEQRRLRMNPRSPQQRL
jgi:hypothetical protein